MRRRTSGFTIIEVVIALLIGGILTSIAMTQFGNARGRFAVRGARNTFVSLQARARAHAIEKGTWFLLVVDPAGDSAWVSNYGTGQIIETIHFGEELHVDLRSTATSIRICMGARGLANPACMVNRTKLQFWHNADSASVDIMPLGQLIY
ncbi:MAG: type II secretion system GspH family protein [Gemmatimonadota bacterium]|nr:type II secretion system GspH family protein [Gemmatimonadota bacterium]MDH5758832.1 type II secretion system GspH family protein [Gemmatimonadota bacterium]